jgi:tetratricopeptide (TPR) repeat protein
MIRRTLSLPVFIASVAALAAGIATFHFVRQWQLSRLSRSFLAQSLVAEQAGNWLAAADDLDRYLRLAPHDQAARVRLAFTYAKGATTLAAKQRAVALHYRALGSQAAGKDDSLRLGLAELLLETGRLLEAEREAQGILDHAPSDPRALRTFALSRYFQWRSGALASKRPAELRLLAAVEKALVSGGDDIALVEVAATLYRDFPEVVAVHRPGFNQHSREAHADGLIDRLVAARPGDAKAFLSRYTYRTKYGLEGARGDLDKALALAPSDPQIVLAAAEAEFQLGRAAGLSEAGRTHLAQAARHYQRVIDENLAPGIIDPHVRLGEIRALEGDSPAALAVWRAALASFSRPTDQLACHGRIADHLLRAGQSAEAKAPLEAADQILATLGGVISRERHLALLQAQGLRRATYFLCLGRHAEAVGEAQNAIARQPQLQPDPATSHFAWDALGRGFAGLEDWTAAATAFDRAANFQPSGTSSRLAAAQAWLCAGRADLAVDRAEQVILIEPLPEAWIILGTGELQMQATTPALDRSWNRVQAALDALSRIEPAQLAAPWRVEFLRADYVALRAATANDPAQSQTAAEVLRLAESKFADDSRFWFEACLAFERLGQAEDAERAWRRLNELPGQRTDAAIAAARRAAMHQNYGRATEILEAAVKNAPLASHSRLRRESIHLAQAQQDLPRMRRLLVAEWKQRPRDVAVLCQLAELDLRTGDLKALAGWEQQLNQAGPLGELWGRYFRIVRLYTSATGPQDPALQEALAEQSQLATLRPNWSESFALRGAIEQRLERLDAAVAAYEQAISLGERRYAVFEQLIACLDKLHRTDDVEKYLARLESYLPSSQRLTEIATQRQLDSDRPQRALDLARRAVAERPQDLRARLWLGRLLLMTNRLTEAGSVFEQATKQAPTDVRSWNGLFTYYLRTGEKERARQVLESIRRHARLDPVELDLVLGQAYVRLGENAEAIRLFAALREQAPNRADVHLQLARMYLETDRDKAKEYLQKAVQLDPKLAQARWLLAAILAAGGSEAELAEAEQLLGSHSLADAPATLEDRRVRALLLSQHGDVEGLGRAVRILEQIIEERADTTNDRLLLAQFYERQAGATSDEAEAKARLAASRDQLVNVAGRSSAQTAEVALLVGFLIRQEDTNEAAVWLDRLEERVRSQSRDDPRAIANLIELRLAHGTIEECVVWIERLEQIDHDPVRPLGARVKYLAKRGKTDEIETLVEARAQIAMTAASEPHERGRIARAIGDIYLTTGLPAQAERWYRIVVREDREQFPVLALTLIRLGRAHEAIALCEAATQHDSTSRPAVVLASILLEAGGKPEHLQLAEGMLDAALAKFPDDPELLYGLGMLRVLADRYPEAITLLRKVVTLNPRHVPALNNLAVIVAEAPDARDQALGFAEQAIVLRGHQPTLLDTKGTILVLGGKSSEALSLLEAAARGVHSDPRHKFHLAIAYHDVGAAEKARLQLAAALKQNLEKQILTPTDRKSLARLQSVLAATDR